jgi:hypothetical protein
MILTTNIKEASLIISYKTYMTDEENDYMIPDDEDLKDCLFNYCLYRFYTSKILMLYGDKNLFKINREMQLYHLSLYETLKTKYTAKSYSPSLNQLENIRKYNSRLISPKSP